MKKPAIVITIIFSLLLSNLGFAQEQKAVDYSASWVAKDGKLFLQVIATTLSSSIPFPSELTDKEAESLINQIVQNEATGIGIVTKKGLILNDFFKMSRKTQLVTTSWKHGISGLEKVRTDISWEESPIFSGDPLLAKMTLFALIISICFLILKLGKNDIVFSCIVLTVPNAIFFALEHDSNLSSFLGLISIAFIIGQSVLLYTRSCRKRKLKV